MMSSTPDLSIVISSFNRDDKVGETLERLYESDLKPFEMVEVLVIDDGSPRPVIAVLQRTGPPPDKMSVRLIRQDNAGIGATRNRGYREATAPLVLFLDDDILVKPTTLIEFVEAHRLHPGGVIFGSCPFASHETEALRQFARGLFAYDLIEDEPTFDHGDALASAILCVDKSKLGDMSSFYRDDLSIPAAEEIEIIYRFNKLGIPIIHARHTSATHNHHLRLDWLALQQFKYGQATAEAFHKVPEITEMAKFARMKKSLDQLEDRGILGTIKRRLSSATERQILMFTCTVLSRLMPAGNHHRLFGYLATANFWAGFQEGRDRFSKDPRTIRSSYGK